MRKFFSFAAIAIMLSLSILSQNAYAQSETPKIEVGAQYSLLRLGLRKAPNIQPPGANGSSVLALDSRVTDSGFGGRVTFNFTDYLSVEGEINFFPEERVNYAEPFYINSRRTQGLFGVKAGARSEKLGVFAKARPGFMHFGEGAADPRIQTLLPIPARVSSTEFALDLGGVLELYPSRRVSVRFDLGDTIIHYGRSSLSGGVPGSTTHNLQFTTGVGLRF